MSNTKQIAPPDTSYEADLYAWTRERTAGTLPLAVDQALDGRCWPEGR